MDAPEPLRFPAQNAGPVYLTGPIVLTRISVGLQVGELFHSSELSLLRFLWFARRGVEALPLPLDRDTPTASSHTAPSTAVDGAAPVPAQVLHRDDATKEGLMSHQEELLFQWSSIGYDL